MKKYTFLKYKHKKFTLFRNFLFLYFQNLQFEFQNLQFDFQNRKKQFQNLQKVSKFTKFECLHSYSVLFSKICLSLQLHSRK